jgi:antitoxin (DNA-binding transcriptional repressor) of toxin-antitoxin stability system
MSITIDAQELPSRLAEILSLAAATGEEIIIIEGNVARARLIPLERDQKQVKRIPGLHPGSMIPAEDFDASLFR